MAHDVVAEIRRAMRKKFRVEDKIRLVLEGLQSGISVSHMCSSARISPALCEVVQSVTGAGKNELTADTKPDATMAVA